MAHITSSLLLLIITWFLPVLSAEALILKARPGDDVTLSCQAPDVDIEAAEWSRADLKKEEYVFLYRDRHTDSIKQHQSFKNRVELKDKEMKNGDLSVILKNVKKEDSGTYECRFKTENVESNITEAKPTSTIKLEVVDPDTGS
ncbi:V-set domain containing T-cell activation inhibitor 1-like [Myripristis murdjan]|uniref:V-set domain containing T-cell activation inhibitor 1-like n=1 Tax=Myripristis murdjan TaxID=586833 RepID=UPI00117639C1|nr:V-set domain containing T-cell activation inhibitor 1-like [Myripristis murdjan]